MAVREISQIDITRDRNRSLSQLHIPARSTNRKLDAKWHWIDRSVIAIAPGSWRTVGLPAGCIGPIATWCQTKTDGQFYDLYPASVTPGRVLDGQFCIRSMLMKESAEQLCRRPVRQRGYSHKALSRIKGMTSAEYWTAQIGAQFGGHGTALTQTILGKHCAVMILQNAVIDNAKKAVISHRK